jgi:DNA-binding transcriptional MerR regulator/quercetin dioxygenase-like cupin family protein
MAALEESMVYSIGDAARLVGTNTNSLRRWEGEGLIQPRRTRGGHRLFDQADVERLRQINYLRRFAKINSAAIRLQMGAATRPRSGSALPVPDATLGSNLRARRRALKLSLAEISARSGLSISFLSSVERGQCGISLGNLFRLADAYGTTVPGLQGRTSSRGAEAANRRMRYVANRGRVVIEDLIASPRALEAQRIQIAPGGESEEPYRHPGEEFICVLAGQVTFWLDEREQYVLVAGDTLSFASTRVHSWRNESSEDATVLWVNAPVVHGPVGDTARQATGARPH